MKTLPLLIACLVCGGAVAASPPLDIPDFSHLRKLAIDSTDITIDQPLMKLASQIAKSSGDPAVKALAGIESIRIYNFEFDRDGVYSRQDIEAVRRQLTVPGWSSVAQIRDREPREDVDVFMSIEGGKPTGLAVIASAARSFTIVHVVGTIDDQTLSQLSGEFGIPKVSRID